MLNDHLKLSVYKFTRKDKETDERAIETAKKKLTSGILNQITSKESEIIVEKTEHNFRGIWKINAKRCVEYSQSDGRYSRP
ncbi:hypothetical protein [Caviibacterium pharyngocola]|uniref:Uncharacterized protein n=1 Tax=Caviibacterium pharyngocola TaxID=28159 RepID=A0A2M8RUI6_9PAST|nr:hypothetical protein [Caviibacterium pharyngocola]PJG82537.1 hypothetical protein CVP04_09390 [Caviibacterium pharyngocola]